MTLPRSGVTCLLALGLVTKGCGGEDLLELCLQVGLGGSAEAFTAALELRYTTARVAG